MQTSLLRNNSRRDSVRRVPQIPSSCATRHLHVGPLGQSARVDDWVCKVERELPLGMVGGEARAVPQATSKGIVNPEGWLLIRMAKIKMIWGDKSFQLVVRLGNDAVLSCPGTKTSGLQDYFLLYTRPLH
ncbi:hypothetical protein PSACC_00065 [Paramicrosporidium saccamoebae]|uniref:Uncharacterized protein n=1 Tax=Paramicrosporidium saccamoebae TaxID=1246581 RepID=A0A2H9TQU2_9FUNG|nr:hypothetical protein PSACC_00065 [Paramicrosporidium saccamoebae]